MTKSATHSRDVSRRSLVDVLVIGTVLAVSIHPASSLVHPAVLSSSRPTDSTTLFASLNKNEEEPLGTSRRSALLLGGSVALASVFATTAAPSPASAFSNAIPEAKKFADKPKRRGSPPKDLGVLPRTTEGIDGPVTSPRLRSCDGNPNCFSTTGDALLEDRQQYGVDFLVPAWVPPSSDPDPLATVAAVVDAYEPGQGGIDGGGFALVTKKSGYLYYQFESLKKGFIDDVEFAMVPGSGSNEVQVRSASRVGFTDFGVNAVRLNYVSSKLRSRGWVIPEITPDTHRDYWVTANEAREATFDADRRNMD
eukprot:CAMPEP_0172406944 /NCGR_PEP_ID=MMETSP1061-20121228/72657_1 /TAXON_ID=37318 /ORGANISM="Pseudo-nitzschia pungens, Strain cf. pungens" /LENGTH=308 /DNA_ID=CAMNT_0013142765 /DNA_START=23 /DNA_END=949 /DNA_ORIENTATION=+